jgi:hypothetical protein
MLIGQAFVFLKCQNGSRDPRARVPTRSVYLLCVKTYQAVKLRGRADPGPLLRPYAGGSLCRMVDMDFRGNVFHVSR